MMIDAMIISCGEPQLERCIESVKNQTVPFSNIIHVDGIIPESVATNMGIQQVTQEWFMRIDGDIILYPNAVSIVTEQIEKNLAEKIGMLIFYSYDSFIRRIVTAGAVVTNTEAVRSVGWKNHLRSDNNTKRKMERYGWTARTALEKAKRIVVGTHFDDPSEFQIFHRFYITAFKWKDSIEGTRSTKDRLSTLYKSTGDSRYIHALKSFEYGLENPEYFGSQNRDYDRRKYEEFKKREK